MLKKTIKILPLFITLKASAFCFDQAGGYYDINPTLLKSIAINESSLKASSINKNKNKSGEIISADYGLMQINSNWFKRLQEFEVTKEKLLNDPCFNVYIGAWILAQNFYTHGFNWNSVGAYNAGFKKSKQKNRDIYIRKIKKTFEELKNKNQ